jgi:hypothetical protein
MWPKIMRKISNWLFQVSTGRVALIGLVIFLLFTALVLPGQSTQAEAVSGEVGSPDMSFFYSPDDLYGMAEAYGELGRVTYIRARFTFDLIWPMVYGFFLCTAISWVFTRGFPLDSRWRWANLVPILGMLFDYLENISTSVVMFRYPSPTPILVWLAPFFTAVKWIFVNGSFVLLVIGAVVALWRAVQKKHGVR